MATTRSAPTDLFYANRLLAALPADEFAALRRQLTVVDLALDDMIIEADAPIHTVYFPLTGVASVVASDEEGDQLEVGTIGRGGWSGSPRSTRPTAAR